MHRTTTHYTATNADALRLLLAILGDEWRLVSRISKSHTLTLQCINCGQDSRIEVVFTPGGPANPASVRATGCGQQTLDAAAAARQARPEVLR